MRLLLALLLAVVPLSPAFAQTPQGKMTVSERQADLGTVLEMITSGRAEDAIVLLDPILADFDTLYGTEKRALYCAHSDAEAKRYAKEAGKAKRAYLLIDADWCFAFWAKGYALVDVKRIRESLPFLERSVAMAPYRPLYLVELGNAYQELRQWDKALATYQRGVDESMPLEGESRTMLLGRSYRGVGFTLIELGRWDEAVAMFNKALELDPSDQRAIDELRYIDQNRPRPEKLKK